MANEFDQTLIDTTADLLAVFGETVTYWPASGGSRSISAVVDRERPADMDGAPHGSAPLLTIEVANDSTSGISSNEIDTGGDKLELAVRIGKSAQKRLVKKIISQDAGMMRLELR